MNQAVLKLCVLSVSALICIGGCRERSEHLETVLEHTLKHSAQTHKPSAQTHKPPSQTGSTRPPQVTVKRGLSSKVSRSALVHAVQAAPPHPDQAQPKRARPLSRSQLLEKNRKGVDGVWREWYRELEQLSQHELKHERLPDFQWTAPFSESKRSNIEKIKELSSRLLIELKNPEIEEMRTQYFELRAKIESDQEAARHAALDGLEAPTEDEASFWENDRGDYQELKRRKEEAVKLYRREQQRLLNRCHDKLVELGIELSSAQVEQLFQMRSGDTMLTLFSTFAQLNLLGDYVTERMLAARGTDDYPHLAQRYYAVYVSIVSLTLSVHRQTYRALQNEHLPRVDQLSERLSEVIGSTQKLIKLEEKRSQTLKRQVKRTGSSPDQIREVKLAQIELDEARRYIKQLRTNLEVQKKAQLGASAYRRHLTQQSQKIKLAARKVERRFKVAFNTYQTVLIGTDQLELIRAGLRDLSNLQKIQVPEMVPLAGDQVTAHLELLSRDFKGDERLQLQQKLKR